MTFKRKTVFFSVAFLVIHSLLLLFNYKANHTKNEVTIQLDQYFKRGFVKTLFLGDSHPKKAIEISIIDSTYSISHSGENNMMNYYKLIYCLTNKKTKPQYIVLPCDILTYSKNYNYSITYKPLYYSFIPINDVPCIDSNVVKAYYDYFKIKLFPYAEWKYIFNKMDLGKKSDGDKKFKTINELTAFTKKLIYNDANINADKESIYYSKALNYLQKTISFCKENHIKPIYIKYPLTHLFLNEIKKATHDSLLVNRPSEIIIANEKIPLLDFEKIYLNREDLFYDSHHLNEKGKIDFSKIVKTKLDSLYKVY